MYEGWTDGTVIGITSRGYDEDVELGNPIVTFTPRNGSRSTYSLIRKNEW
jgi:hypothetical protein